MAFPKRNKLGGRKPGSLNKSTLEIRAFAQNILTRPSYVESLKRRLDKGQAPHMETLLHHYAYGKPRDEVNVGGTIVLEWAS